MLEHWGELVEHESEAALDMYFVKLDCIAAEVLDTVAGGVVEGGKEPGNKNLSMKGEEEAVVEPRHMKLSPQWWRTNTEGQMWGEAGAEEAM